MFNIKYQRLEFMILVFGLSFWILNLSVDSFAQHQNEVSQRKIKYWTCGMHPQVRQDKPGNCPICNMKLIPIYEEEKTSSQPRESKDINKPRKILYYRNPMNPAITSKVPAKDQMGMDYIPVYEEAKPSQEGESNAQNIIKLSQRDISLAGVESEPVAFRQLFKEIRTVGRIAYDTALYKAEEEFIQAVKTKKELEKSDMSEVKNRSQALIDAARLKLRLNGLSDEQINQLSQQEEPDRSLIISDSFSPYVWVYADVYEYELSWVKTGQAVKVISESFPAEEFKGKIEAIDPILNSMTRSVRIRVKIDNPQFKLKPQMYVDVLIESAASEGDNSVLTVPRDAVLDTGVRKIVYLDLGEGSYAGKEVKVGPVADAYVNGEKMKFYPVVDGLKEGDMAVTKANFLIDSQSQISGIAAAAYSGALGTSEETKTPVHQH